jgi:hypothetical protein
MKKSYGSAWCLHEHRTKKARDACEKKSKKNGTILQRALNAYLTMNGENWRDSFRSAQ